jgi:hypothetical protein
MLHYRKVSHLQRKNKIGGVVSGIDSIPMETQETSGESMLMPEDIEMMLCLHKKGWSIRKIALELDISRNTVGRYLNPHPERMTATLLPIFYSSPTLSGNC